MVGQVILLTNNHHFQIIEHLTNQNLSGWDIIESESCRWTNGNAMLNVLPNNKAEKRILVFEVLAAGPYLCQPNLVQELNIA